MTVPPRALGVSACTALVVGNTVGPGFYLSSAGILTEAFGGVDFVTPPIPNRIFQRDPTCWIYGGVTCDPMFWRAWQPETLLQRSVYKVPPEIPRS